MGMAANGTLVIERRPSAAIVTLNRPTARNALNGVLLEALERELAAIAADCEIVTLVLRGAGDFFCAGGDLKERRDMPLRGPGQSLEQRSRLEGRLLARIARQPQLTMAVVEGGAIGAGLGMLCASDVVLATTTSIFGTPEVLTGAMPAQIAPYVISCTGWREGRRLLLTGCRIDATEAQRLGLVHETSDDAGLEQIVEEKLERFSRIDRTALAATKALLRRIFPVADDYPDSAAQAVVAGGIAVRNDQQD